MGGRTGFVDGETVQEPRDINNRVSVRVRVSISLSVTVMVRVNGQ